MTDYKEQVQAAAEELAFELYDAEFCELPPAVRDRVYEMASERVSDNYLSQADYCRTSEKERA